MSHLGGNLDQTGIRLEQNEANLEHTEALKRESTRALACRQRKYVASRA